MPLQVLPPRPMLGTPGNPQLRATEVVVVLPVVEVGVDVVAYLELVVRCDRHVAGIEQLVDIGPQQQPVPDIVLWFFLEGPDVSRLERRKCLLACYSALPPVHVGNDGPEDPPPDSGLDGHRVAVAAGNVEPATRLGLRDDGSAQAASRPYSAEAPGGRGPSPAPAEEPGTAAGPGSRRSLRPGKSPPERRSSPQRRSDLGETGCQVNTVLVHLVSAIGLPESVVGIAGMCTFLVRQATNVGKHLCVVLHSALQALNRFEIGLPIRPRTSSLRKKDVTIRSPRSTTMKSLPHLYVHTLSKDAASGHLTASDGTFILATRSQRMISIESETRSDSREETRTVDQERVLATIVLAAGLPGRLETAQRMVDLFSATDPTGHYAIEPVDDDRSVPATEEDWSFRIVRQFGFRSELTVSAKRRVEVVPMPPNPDSK